MKTKWVIVFILVFSAASFFGGYLTANRKPLSPYTVDKDHPPEDKWLKVPVVDPWKGKSGPNGVEGLTVGHLYVKTREGQEYTEVHFVHEGDTCRYSGQMAWEALGRAMNGHGPMFGTKVMKD